MINYSYYPILKSSLAAPITEFKEQLILMAKNNIEKYIPTNILDIDNQVFLISTIIIRNINNNFLTRRFVSNYGKLFELHFTRDIQNGAVRNILFNEYFNIKKPVIFEEKRKVISLHMIDYLELSTVNNIDKKETKRFSLAAIAGLENGIASVEVKDFVYLCRLVVEFKLFEKIKSIKEYKENKLINGAVSELKPKYPDYINKKNNSTIIPISIQELIDKAYKTHHLDHHERIKVGVWTQAQEWDMEDILDIFRQLSDWNEKVTRYQLNSLRRYIK